MILRTGVDLIEISRISEVIARHGKHYLERIYTSAELEQCGKNVESLAGRFAAKEAVAKALGTGIGDVTWKEIEILGDEQNAPMLTLRGAAESKSKELGLTEWSVSISHSQSHAVAVTVATGQA
jgi:holo-[acyl-carrier protein] synthase